LRELSCTIPKEVDVKIDERVAILFRCPVDETTEIVFLSHFVAEKASPSPPGVKRCRKRKRMKASELIIDSLCPLTLTTKTQISDIKEILTVFLPKINKVDSVSQTIVELSSYFRVDSAESGQWITERGLSSVCHIELKGSFKHHVKQHYPNYRSEFFEDLYGGRRLFQQ
ncbi:hypothetical protein L9F63_021417, partial [Diploptera punctata]